MGKTVREMFDEIIMAVPFTKGETRYIPKIKVALEKQIPKKPTVKKSIKVNAFALRCPNCEAVLQSDSPHCRYCGQALDWSVDNDR